MKVPNEVHIAFRSRDQCDVIRKKRAIVNGVVWDTFTRKNTFAVIQREQKMNMSMQKRRRNHGRTSCVVSASSSDTH